jgi:predicted secreted protein
MRKISQFENIKNFEDKYLLYKHQYAEGLYQIKNGQYIKINAPANWSAKGPLGINYTTTIEGWYELSIEELNKYLIGVI